MPTLPNAHPMSANQRNCAAGGRRREAGGAGGEAGGVGGGAPGGGIEAGGGRDGGWCDATRSHLDESLRLIIEVENEGGEQRITLPTRCRPVGRTGGVRAVGSRGRGWWRVVEGGGAWWVVVGDVERAVRVVEGGGRWW